jgi:hypothetical protein
MMNGFEMMMKTAVSNMLGGIDFEKAKENAAGLFQRFQQLEQDVAELKGKATPVLTAAGDDIAAKVDALAVRLETFLREAGSNVTEARLIEWEQRMEAALEHFGFGKEAQAKLEALNAETPAATVAEHLGDGPAAEGVPHPVNPEA